jgi:hypothetical protein
VTVTPTYSDCTAVGQPMNVRPNGCNCVLSTGTPIAGGWHITKTLPCRAEKSIEVHTGTCALAFSPQRPLTTSEVTNAGVVTPETGMDLLLHTNITGITYIVTKDNIGCSLTALAGKLWHQGDYEGTTLVKAHDSVTQVSVGITLH